jgi:hypothetical protein
MKDAKLIFMTIIGFSAGLVANDSREADEWAQPTGSIFTTKVVDGPKHVSEFVNAAGVTISKTVDVVAENMSKLSDVAGVKALELKDAAVELKDAAVDTFGAKVARIQAQHEANRKTNDLAVPTKASETSSSSVSEKEIAKAPVKVVDIKVDGKKSMASMYDRIVNNPGITIGITTAVAAVVGITYYVYTQYGVNEDTEIENN